MEERWHIVWSDPDGNRGRGGALPFYWAMWSAEWFQREVNARLVYIEEEEMGKQKRTQQQDAEQERRYGEYVVGWWTDNGTRGSSEALPEEEARKVQKLLRQSDPGIHAVVQRRH
jgi:hypothetical protein